MKSLRKLFRSQNTEVTAPDMRIINGIMVQIDEATQKIFHSSGIELLSEPLTNVVEAVWGVATDEAQLTYTQFQIARTIRPMISKIQDSLETEELIRAKNCVIDYLIKRLIIFQLTFMIERYKSIAADKSKSIDIYNLADIEVAGNA